MKETLAERLVNAPMDFIAEVETRLRKSIIAYLAYGVETTDFDLNAKATLAALLSLLEFGDVTSATLTGPSSDDASLDEMDNMSPAVVSHLTTLPMVLIEDAGVRGRVQAAFCRLHRIFRENTPAN